VLVDCPVPGGTLVHAGVPVALVRYAGFGAVATVPPEVAYRFYAEPTGGRVQVTGGPGPTDCTPLPVARRPIPARRRTRPTGRCRCCARSRPGWS
jgi:hypothetical protein